MHDMDVSVREEIPPSLPTYLPMAMTSPTDVMLLPSLVDTLLNLLRSHRGTFTTQ